jgi:DNA repair exonuclease SbcCD ATPase subunit
LEEPNLGMPELKMSGGNAVAHTPVRQSGELSTDVRTKLHKLERLESKYQELLRAYRVAHARVQTIEPFEASLRENTPLTSINDPGALLEYLNQITLKSDMVVDELKRIAVDRDSYRKKFDESENESQLLKAEIARLKQQEQKPEASEPSAIPELSPDLSNAGESTSAAAIDPAASAKAPTPSSSSRLPSFSLFSPKSKAAKSPEEQPDTAEEFFSYDTELPRLEAELQERQTEITDLKEQISTLQGDLSVARESTEGMVQGLEAATRELHSLRDANEKHELSKRELQMKVEGLVQETSALASLRADSSSLNMRFEDQKAVLDERESKLSSMSKAEEEIKSELSALKEDLEALHEKIAQKDATIKDLEDSLAMAQAAQRQQAQISRSETASQKQIGILNDIMESLRSQLKAAEREITDLKKIKSKAEIEIEHLHEHNANYNERMGLGKVSAEGIDQFKVQIAELPSMKYFGFVNNSEEFSLSGDPPNAFRQFSDKLKNTRPELYEALTSSEKSKDNFTTTSEPPKEPNDANKKSKKKKRKNKRGQGSVAEPFFHEPPAKVMEPLEGAEDEAQMPSLAQINAQRNLEQQIKDLEIQLKEKGMTIESLHAKLKDQDTLNEEIETLRDDLLHQGQGHVEANMALKRTRLEKAALEARVANIEEELTELKAHSATSSAESQKAHHGLLSELEGLKTKSGDLQRDLVAAEQLAASRFKDITDLRELLSKAQPELRSLRSEVEELRSIREDFKNKAGELSRLEMRHEDLKADSKNMSKRIGEKDSELKDLRQKFADGINVKTKAEEDLRSARFDLQRAEGSREAALKSQRQLSEDLSKTKADCLAARSKVRELEEAVSEHIKEVQKLQDELSLQTSLHDSTQAIVAGLREQTLELSTQAREAGNKADSLEEELAEAQRMLSERSREAETMRRLLADIEGQTSTKIREMKERMESAIEERDRVEDEASTSNRRMAREVEDLRNKMRESSRSLKALEEEKEELERSQKDLKRRRDELEAVQDRARAEVNEAQAAIQQLREALDQRERESMDFARDKAETKRVLEDLQERMERLQKANKALTDELKSIQQQRKGSLRPIPAAESEVQSSRSSVDSARPHVRNNSTAGSPVPFLRDRLPSSRSSTPTGPVVPTIDYVYLKNVLLQFLEQKDKGHQKQLIPVLGMLLNFDR